MFGTYRTCLAIAVVVHHLISIPILGHYAVHGFFILSGYLMTYIMINSYGYSFYGIRSFTTNRFLRLYPSYWAILAITIAAIYILGEDNSSSYRAFVYYPDSFLSIIQNISLLYFDMFPGSVSPRLSPPTWALTIEIIFYILIALGISRSKQLTGFWFLASIGYMSFTHIFNLDYSYRYDVVIAGTLPFSVGAMIFHYYDDPRLSFIRNINQNVVFMLCFLFIFNSGIAAVGEKMNFSDAVFSWSFYVNYIINAMLIIYLIDGRIPYISRDLDSQIGNYSYPIYLSHWLAGFIASMIIWGEPVRGFNIQGIVSLLVALVICFLVSFFVIKFIDLPVERLRQKIKRKANSEMDSNTKGRAPTSFS